MRSRRSDEEVWIYREADHVRGRAGRTRGAPVADVCRQLGGSEATFYIRRKKYDKLGVSELRQLRQLRDENVRLKRPVADLTLDRHILQEVLKK